MGDPIVPLTKTPYLVSRLAIVDENGKEVPENFELREGANKFYCMATYIDSTTGPFDAYWTCPIYLARRTPPKTELWSVLGRQRRQSAVIHAHENHERYSELACWVFPPDAGHPTTANPRKAISFDYSALDK